MQIQLPPALQAMVQDRVASGMYRDESEVVGEALRLLEQRDWDDVDWEKLDAAVAEGEADLAAGRYIDVDSPQELRALMSGA